jgi:hypothetical protein
MTINLQVLLQIELRSVRHHNAAADPRELLLLQSTAIMFRRFFQKLKKRLIWYPFSMNRLNKTSMFFALFYFI